MKLNKIIKKVTDKDKFLSIVDYADFCMFYLEYIKDNLQAVIVSRNENNYRFFQYNKQGTYNITRPINSDLMFSIEEFLKKKEMFFNILNNIRDKNIDTVDNRKVINNFVYTCQQSIGASLDALPANRSNTARKINGDLFERFIRLILNDIGLNVTSSTVAIPVKIDGEIAFNMNYQHDLLIQVDKNIKAIGSVKTSSKDRLDKIFIDKLSLAKE